MAQTRKAQVSGAALSLFLVASCGGGGADVVGGPQPQPVPQPIPPVIPTEVTAFEALAASQSNTMIGSADGQADQTVVISEGTAGDGKLMVKIGATDYVLGGAVSNGQPVFTSSASGSSVSVAQTDKESAAALALVGFGAANPDERRGYSVLGALTARSELDNLQITGVTATYAGSSHLVATRSDGARDSADGTVTITVDFNGGIGSVYGNLDLQSNETATGGNQFEIQDVNLVLSNGDIVPGGIVAELDAGQSNFVDGSNQLRMEPVPGQLQGKFYGAGAQNLGGSFEFKGTNVYALPSQKLDIVVKGGFLGDRQ